jgi:hypothetical protein
MIVSAWKGGTYGIRIGAQNVRIHFPKSVKTILVEVGGKVIRCKLKPTFWRTCPEIRSKVIGDWLHHKNLIPWKKGQPPRFSLTATGKAYFVLK